MTESDTTVGGLRFDPPDQPRGRTTRAGQRQAEEGATEASPPVAKQATSASPPRTGPPPTPPPAPSPPAPSAPTHAAYPSSPPLQQLAVQVSHFWWVPLLTGLISIGLGLAVLASDWTVKALVVTAGIFMVVRGLATAFSPHYAAGGRGEHVLAGVIGMVAGIVLIGWPEPTLLVLAVVLGAFLTVSGAFHIISSVARRHAIPHWFFSVGVGVVELLLGIWVMRRPDVTLDLIITVFGLWAVITGVIYCVLAFEVRSGDRALAAGAVPAQRTIDIRDA